MFWRDFFQFQRRQRTRMTAGGQDFTTCRACLMSLRCRLHVAAMTPPCFHGGAQGFASSESMGSSETTAQSLSHTGRGGSCKLRNLSRPSSAPSSEGLRNPPPRQHRCGQTDFLPRAHAHRNACMIGLRDHGRRPKRENVYREPWEPIPGTRSAWTTTLARRFCVSCASSAKVSSMATARSSQSPLTLLNTAWFAG